MMRTMGPPGAAGAEPKPKDRPANERILALLTEEQSRRWEEMTGAPFKGALAPFPPLFGPPPPPPR
jgi:hypothetical protein